MKILEKPLDGLKYDYAKRGDKKRGLRINYTKVAMSKPSIGLLFFNSIQ